LGVSESVLVIPGPPPPSLNQQERMHWAKRQRVRDWWAQQAWVVWLRAGQPRFERPVIQYRLYYRDNRRRDQDNAIASCKPILDGLKGHAFEDDHSGVVTILPPVVDVDKDKPRVEVVMRERETQEGGRKIGH